MTEIRYIKVAVRWGLENAKLRGCADIRDGLRIQLTVNSVEETIYDEESTVTKWLLDIRNASSLQTGRQYRTICEPHRGCLPQTTGL